MKALLQNLRALPPEDRRLFWALAFTFAAHGVAMLGMAAFLLPMVPGGGGGSDYERVARIAASPMLYRLGWLGWQITAVSDIVFAIALLRVRWAPRSWALAQLVFVLLAVIPDQGAQAMLVTRGIELARAAAESHDLAPFLAFEEEMFPLTSAWAALLYSLGGIAWAFTFWKGGRWNRVLAYLSAPMLSLFLCISVGPILPKAIRPSAELIGFGNALAFMGLCVWLVAVMVAVLTPREPRPRGSADS